MSAISEIYIYRQMIKAKAIVTAPGFPQHIITKVESATLSQESAQANIQARLFNSAAVKTAMINIMVEIGAALEIHGNSFSKRKKRLRASDYATRTLTSNEEIQRKLEGKSPPGSVQDVDKKLALDDKSHDSKPCKSLLVGFSSSDSASEQFSQKSLVRVDDVNRSHFKEGLIPSSPSPTISVAIPPESRPHKKSISVTKSTTFIPSLTMGGYISDSESVGSVASQLGKNNLKSRKNRRGQQERRQIWEKKFGKNANHLKRQSQSQNSNQSWNSRSVARRNNERGAHRNEKRQNSQNVSTRLGGGGPMSSGANSDPVKAKPQPNGKGDSEKPLHPSWEAAKKGKEIKKNVAFQGKKIVFD